MINNIPEKCHYCMHRRNTYCRAYQVAIELIEIDKCRRKKIEIKGPKINTHVSVRLEDAVDKKYLIKSKQGGGK